MTYVYILRSIENPRRYYVGITGDLRARIKEHNAREVSHTSKYAPWEIKTFPLSVVSLSERNRQNPVPSLALVGPPRITTCYAAQLIRPTGAEFGPHFRGLAARWRETESLNLRNRLSPACVVPDFLCAVLFFSAFLDPLFKRMVGEFREQLQQRQKRRIADRLSQNSRHSTLSP
jgi:hypothetical protein